MSIASWRRRTLLASGLALVAAGGCASGQAGDGTGARGPVRSAIARKRQQRSAEETPPSGPAAADASMAPGNFQVETIDGVWIDAARADRRIPWRAYLPLGVKEPAPAALYSHGGGGTRASGAQYGQHIASHGIASIHLEHAGSDRDAFRANPQQISAAARDPKIGAPRFLDVGFAYRQLQEADGPLRGRIEPARCGIYGHSFGAITTQIVAGQYVTGFDQSLAIPDLKGAIALSPSPPRAGYGDEQTAFRSMLMPMFSFTGTEDDAPNGDFQAPARRVPFDRTTSVEQVLVILKGANHFTFGGDANPQLGGRSYAYPGLDRHHAVIRAGILAFWKATLNRDAASRDYLWGGAYQKLLAPADVFESKPAQ